MAYLYLFSLFLPKRRIMLPDVVSDVILLPVLMHALIRVLRGFSSIFGSRTAKRILMREKIARVFLYIEPLSLLRSSS